MANPTGTTCILCLRADEAEGIIALHLDYGLPWRSIDVAICRECAYAIKLAYDATDVADPLQGEIDDSGHINFGRGAGGDAAFDEAANSALPGDSAGAPDSGVDRPEPEGTPGGQVGSRDGEIEARASRVRGE